MSEQIYRITNDDEGVTVERFLRGRGFGRSALSGLKRYDDGMLCNGKQIRTIDPLRAGDILKVNLRDSSDIIPNASLNVPIVYEDNELIVFNKPAFMPVHPSIGHCSDTLANYYAALFPNAAFRCVNRLDRNTSGLVIVAKSRPAAMLLNEKKFSPRKLYYAVVKGDLSAEYGSCGEIIAPIARKSESIITREVNPAGKYAHTVFKVAESCGEHSFLEISLVTGGTHQIRVHFSGIGYPLLGDELYGGDMRLINRQALHCGRAELILPVCKTKIVIKADLPEDIRSVLQNNAIQL